MLLKEGRGVETTEYWNPQKLVVETSQGTMKTPLLRGCGKGRAALR